MSYYNEQTRIFSNQAYSLFLIQVFQETAAEQIVLSLKHVYIWEQQFASRILLNNSVKHKKLQLTNMD